MNNKRQSGFSIIEVIVGVMIIGIAFVAFMNVHANVRLKSANVEIMLRASGLANSIMELIRAHDFYDDVASESTLGPDEASPDDYDDLDDYAGFAWSITNYENYSVETRVFFVNPSVSWIDSVGVVTSFKRIIVSVDHSELASPLILTSLYAEGI